MANKVTHIYQDMKLSRLYFFPNLTVNETLNRMHLDTFSRCYVKNKN